MFLSYFCAVFCLCYLKIRRLFTLSREIRCARRPPSDGPATREATNFHTYSKHSYQSKGRCRTQKFYSQSEEAFLFTGVLAHFRSSHEERRYGGECFVDVCSNILVIYVHFSQKYMHNLNQCSFSYKSIWNLCHLIAFLRRTSQK